MSSTSAPLNNLNSDPGLLRRNWYRLKRVYPVGAIWGGVRKAYFSARNVQRELSYIPHHVTLRRKQWTRLQLGAGTNPLTGWLNTDLRAAREVLPLDVRKPFTFADNVFEYVLCEHMVEHLTHADAARMIGEIHRVLAPGGTLRLSTPDFDFYLGLFREDLTAQEKEFIEWHVRRYTPSHPVHPLSVVNTIFHSWGHKFLYNQQTLTALLQAAGFGKIVRFNAGESSDPNLRSLEAHGKLVGEDRNKLETLVLEATKLR